MTIKLIQDEHGVMKCDVFPGWRLITFLVGGSVKGKDGYGDPRQVIVTLKDPEGYDHGVFNLQESVQFLVLYHDIKDFDGSFFIAIDESAPDWAKAKAAEKGLKVD